MSTQTVSKTTPASPSSAEPVAQPTPVERVRKTQTDWSVFEDLRIAPGRVKCDGYLSHHPADISCHANILPTAKDLIRHFHGGRDQGEGWLKIKFRRTDSDTPHKLWKELEDAGVEIHQLHCPHCRQNVPLVGREIMYHLQNHPGANRVNLDPQVLCFTLGIGMPQPDGGFDSGF